MGGAESSKPTPPSVYIQGYDLHDAFERFESLFNSGDRVWMDRKKRLTNLYHSKYAAFRRHFQHGHELPVEKQFTEVQDVLDKMWALLRECEEAAPEIANETKKNA